MDEESNGVVTGQIEPKRTISHVKFNLIIGYCGITYDFHVQY